MPDTTSPTTTFSLPGTATPYRHARPLPPQDEYLQLVETALNRHELSAEERVVARAFAKALYRRAVARRVQVEVRTLVEKATVAATARLLGNPTATHRKKRTDAYGVRFSLSRRKRTLSATADPD